MPPLMTFALRDRLASRHNILCVVPSLLIYVLISCTYSCLLPLLKVFWLPHKRPRSHSCDGLDKALVSHLAALPAYIYRPYRSRIDVEGYA